MNDAQDGKPSWDNAPEWANWLAMDGDGWWFWYALEPSYDHDDDVWFCDDDDDQEPEIAADFPDESGIDWDYAHITLEQRPGAARRGGA